MGHWMWRIQRFLCDLEPLVPSRYRRKSSSPNYKVKIEGIVTLDFIPKFEDVKRNQEMILKRK